MFSFRIKVQLNKAFALIEPLLPRHWRSKFVVPLCRFVSVASYRHGYPSHVSRMGERGSEESRT